MKKDSKDVHVTNTVFFYKSGRTFYSRSSFREASGKPSGYYEAGIQGQLDSTWAQKPGTKTLLSFPFYLSTLPGFFFFFFKQNKEKPLLSTAQQYCHPSLLDVKGLPREHHERTPVREVVMERDPSLFSCTFHLNNTGTEFQFYIWTLKGCCQTGRLPSEISPPCLSRTEDLGW